jgi:hypothetical protein
VLSENLEGRFFVRTSTQDLVVELYKPRGRAVELAVEAGIYDVRLEREKGSLVARTQVADGARVVLDSREFGQAPPPDPTARRGGAPRPRFAVSGRNRFELVTGTWRVGDPERSVTAGTDTDVMGGIAYTHYFREDLAVTLSLVGVGIQSGAVVSSRGVASGTVGGFATLVGARWNPLKGNHALHAVKPFVSVAAGPISGVSEGSFVGADTISTGSTTHTTLGGHFGGGVDFHVTRSLSIGLDVGYNAMLNFSRPVGLRDNLNGPQVAVGIGWLFGKGD